MNIKKITLLLLAFSTQSAFAAFEPSSVDGLNGNSTTPIPKIDSAAAIQGLDAGSYNQSPRNGVLLPGEVDIKQLLPSSGDVLPPPYGANLFAGGYESERSDGLNDNYLIAAGDKINIWLWGAVTYSDLVTVDNQGNIFIKSHRLIQCILLS
jgi:hypothetical protein